jgi:uncharacterized protein (TIGR02246 family)
MVAASLPQEPVPGSPEELSMAFAEALRKRDVERAVELWVDEPTILAPTGEALQGREAVRAALIALIENGADVQIELSRSVTAGDVALGLGTLTLSGVGADGEPFNQRSSSAVIYSRAADGRWRIAIDAPWGLPSP